MICQNTMSVGLLLGFIKPIAFSYHLMKFGRRKRMSGNKVAYLHYGWLDWVDGYHDIVKQVPYEKRSTEKFESQ